MPQSAFLNQVTQFINQTGFPVFVAVVLLWKVEAMHVANLNAIHALTEAVRALHKCIQLKHPDAG